MCDGDFMFCLNLNCRYLVVYEIPERSVDVVNSLINLISRFKVKSLKFDGSRAYNSDLVRDFCSSNDIRIYSESSPFTNHNRLIDRVIRTIRDFAFKMDTDNIDKVVEYYNNKVHRVIKCSPSKMMEDPTGELLWIAKCEEKCRVVESMLKLKGILDYKSGCRIMVHLDVHKTNNKFMKRRRVFDTVCKFVKYSNGNVIVVVAGTERSVPMYCTRPLPEGWVDSDHV